LTTNGGTSPAWSPDGRQIAFLREGEVYLVPPIGGAERKLAGDLKCSSRLGWSPDSKYIASSGDKPSGACRIVLLPVDGGEPVPVTDPPSGSPGDSNPVYSPDGRMLAFLRNPAAYQSDIYVVPVAGSPPKPRGQPVRVTFDAVSMAGMTWTADSKELVFSSIRVGVTALWRVSASGKTTPQRVGVGTYGRDPNLSLSGNLLAFQESRVDSNIWRFDGPSIGAGRTPPTQVIASTQQDTSPRFSPDGKKIAFASQRSGANEIWLADSDGRNPVQLTALGRALNGTPRWSPDSRWITFDSRVAGQPDIYVISVDGGAPRRLTKEPTENITPSWSHDGHWIYFVSNRSGDFQVWKMPVAGGQAKQITRHGGFAALESKDGKFIYYAKSRTSPGIWKAPVDGGEESLVIEDAGGAVWGYFDVLRDGICYVPEKRNPRPPILFFDFANKQSRLLASMEKPVLRTWPGLALTPDERWLLITQIDSSVSDLMLVENFR
jgi:Tol biopolymer transport system component